MSNFAIIRLGKDSVEDIKRLDALHQSPVEAVKFTVSCKQVPLELGDGDYAFFCFGSDNNKGVATDWLRGIRAFGTVTGKSGGPGRNDQWDVAVDIRVVIPQTVTRKDLLYHAATAYYWCCEIPIIGIDANSQQTIQIIKLDEPNQNVSALMYGIKSQYPVFEDDIIKSYPDLLYLFKYEPSFSSEKPHINELVSLSFDGDFLKNLADRFSVDAISVDLRVTAKSVYHFAAAILSKRFLIATGLAGSGKTKLAQAFSRWITPDPGWVDAGDLSKGKKQNPCYALIPVGADWTGNDNVVGYPDGLQPGDGSKPGNYITRPALELIRHAGEPGQAGVPHFLILDEMNLSHVERYFADLLSAIESGEEIPLYEGEERVSNGKPVPKKLRLPDNLFIIGTVNVDETTYMFSPKVLDRANVIEFRMEPGEFAAFLAAPKSPNLDALDGKGVGFGQAFVTAAEDKNLAVPASIKGDFEKEMLLFFNLLREHNAEFGYRTGYEAARFVQFYKMLGGYSDDNADWFNAAMDAVIVQKFLPKLHGARSRLEGLLWALAWACGAERDGNDFATQLTEASQAMDESQYGPEVLWEELKQKNSGDPAQAARYPLSYDKVMRMWRKLVRDQFVNFAEA